MRRGSEVGAEEAPAEAVGRDRIWQEGATMVLYVSVVLLATLAVLESGHADGEGTHGPVGGELVAIIWGTTIGLAGAHWFAFRVATQGLGGGHLRGEDFKEAMAQLGGAAFVAAVATLPVLLLDEDTEQLAVSLVLAVTIGVVGYVIERVHGRSLMASAVFGVITLLAALLVATLKNVLVGH
jgi:hypothetical protein